MSVPLGLIYLFTRFLVLLLLFFLLFCLFVLKKKLGNELFSYVCILVQGFSLLVEGFVYDMFVISVPSEWKVLYVKNISRVM